MRASQREYPGRADAQDGDLPLAGRRCRKRRRGAGDHERVGFLQIELLGGFLRTLEIDGVDRPGDVGLVLQLPQVDLGPALDAGLGLQLGQPCPQRGFLDPRCFDVGSQAHRDLGDLAGNLAGDIVL